MSGSDRLERVLSPGFGEELLALALPEVRARRDECLAEREYLSLLRRLVQGHLDILREERERRADGDDRPLVDRLPGALSSAEPRSVPRGEAVKVQIDEAEIEAARQHVAGLTAELGVSDPGSLGDEDLTRAIEVLDREEREVSARRARVLAVHDRLQAELIRRYKEDPSQVTAS